MMLGGPRMSSGELATVWDSRRVLGVVGACGMEVLREEEDMLDGAEGALLLPRPMMHIDVDF